MRVLVTGAGGYLGRRVVAAFAGAGHAVRALLRSPPESGAGAFDGLASVEIAVGDVLDPDSLRSAMTDIDVVVHLAAAVIADEDAQFNSAVIGTENLVTAMHGTGVQRLLLASSFSVYGFRACSGTLDESTPLEDDLYTRGGYAIAKYWQERAARRLCAQHGIALTVLRPGFIWGLDRPGLPALLFGSGRLRGVLGMHRQLPLTYVENCAASFLLAATHQDNLPGDTWNVVDRERISAWQFAGDHLRHQGQTALRIPIPFLLPQALAVLADAVRRLLFGPGGRLPSLLTPSNLAVFKPLRFPPGRLYDLGDGGQPFSYAEAWQRTAAFTAGTQP